MDTVNLCLLPAIAFMLQAFLSFALGAFENLNKAECQRLQEEENHAALKLSRLLKDEHFTTTALRIGKVFAKLQILPLALFADEKLRTLLFGAERVDSLLAFFVSALLLACGYLVVYYLFSELMPYRIGYQTTDVSVYAVASPLRFFVLLFTPATFLIHGISRLLLRLFGLKEQADDSLSKEEIQTIVEESGESGELEESEREMLTGIFEFNDKTADEVMTPRTDVFMINADEPLSEHISEILAENYSRIPVYRDNIDNIIGIFYLKDFISQAYEKGFVGVRLEDCLHQTFFVPEKKNVNALYREMRDGQKHFAVLIDEYGGFSGIVTLEDLIEEVMGNIEDEYDEAEEEVTENRDGSFHVSGITPIREVNEEIGSSFNEEDDDYDTIGGLILKLLGHIPEENEQVALECDGYLFEVEEIGDKRIDSVRITPIQSEEEQ